MTLLCFLATVIMADLGMNANRKKDNKYQFQQLSTAEKDKILEGKDKKSTKRATDGAVEQLKQFLIVKNLPELDNVETDDLPNILKEFYSAIIPNKPSNPEQKEYSVQTLKCKRAALNRFFKAKRGVDIVSDPRFVACNEQFKGVTVKAKGNGLGVKRSTPKIIESDLHKLGLYFNHDHMNDPNPKKLQEMVLFNIVYFFLPKRKREFIHYDERNFSNRCTTRWN